MQSAQKRNNEAESLIALQNLEILDTGSEAEFDALAHAASIICGTPAAFVSLVDAERQWFKANVGLPGLTETPRDLAFCAHAVLDDQLFEVEDASRDARFAGNPLVTGRPDIRFYAGAPLCMPDGTRIGTLCVLAGRPRQLSQVQRPGLQQLSVAVVQALLGRLAVRRMHAAAPRIAVSADPISPQDLVENAIGNVDSAVLRLLAGEADIVFANPTDLMPLEPAAADRIRRQEQFAYREQPTLSAARLCLKSTAALLSITQKLLKPQATETPYEREQQWKQLAADTKVAGRSAYQAALVLSDPLAQENAA
ncbi:MAG: GAF domain-containing protein [Variovorax sp.]